MIPNETIYALSSGQLPAAIAVIRISGSKTKEIMSLIIGHTPNERILELVKIKDFETNEVLDQGLATFFDAKRSITGEDLAELHVHGSHAVVQDLFVVLSRIRGVRPAEPGEFTKRSLYNGKIGLMEVEALSDLIEAETSLQRKQAINQMRGNLSKKYIAWRQDLIKIRAELEAALDFSDELDVESNNREEQQKNVIKKLIKNIKNELKRGEQGELIRRGVKVALIGAPNVGKSSLINLLLKEKRAIVSPEAGTTRDVIEARLSLNGIFVYVYDTAGIRSTKNRIEFEGIKRSKNIAKAADIIVLISEPGKKNNRVLEKKIVGNSNIIEVTNKIDLYQNINVDGLALSCKTRKGFKGFVKALEKEVEKIIGKENEEAGPTRLRHVSNLKYCLSYLSKSLTQLSNNNIEISAEYLRAASVSLGRVVGSIDVEDVLDRLFKGFCIGK